MWKNVIGAAVKFVLKQMLGERVYYPCNYKYMEKIKVEQHGFTAFSWFAGWLFTLGFLHLEFWKGLLAILLWPYYLGVFVSTLAQN